MNFIISLSNDWKHIDKLLKEEKGKTLFECLDGSNNTREVNAHLNGKIEKKLHNISSFSFRFSHFHSSGNLLFNMNNNNKALRYR